MSSRLKSVDILLQMLRKQEIKGKGQLDKLPQSLTYEFFEENRYKISQTGNLESLCNNGFIKLYTLNTRVYWHAQNQFQHRLPDWKFHVSVQHKDVKRAWNLLVGLFIKLKCRAGMKVIYLREAQNPEPGRQITIYIVKIDPKFKLSSFASDFGVSLADEHSEEFWINFVGEIEVLLDENEIQPNGLANGDYGIGKYVSLRNEAFVLNNTGNYIYPPNERGWNPLQHPLPLSIAKLQHDLHQQPSTSIQKVLYSSIPLLALTFGLWALHH